MKDVKNCYGKVTVIEMLISNIPNDWKRRGNLGKS